MDSKLYDMMHGTPSNQEKDRFEVARDKKIKEEVDELIKLEDPKQHQLQSHQLRHEQLEQEMRQASDLTQFEGFLTSAIKILQAQGLHYLGEKNQALLMTELSQIRSRLDALDLESLTEDSFVKVFAISDEAKSSILNVAIEKFEEKLLSDSLSLFVLLSLLDPLNPDFLYRLGLIAQENGENQLALQSFNTVSELDPEFIGSHIFAAKCYLDINEKDKALKEFAEAKQILSSAHLEKEWGSQVADFEQLLSA